MTVGSPQAIAPVPAAPAGYSLLVAADTPAGEMVPADPPEQSEPQPWEQGLEWAPEQVLGGAAVGVDCFGSSAGFGDIGANPVTNTADPFIVSAMDKCSTFGWKGRDWIGRARRQLIAIQSHWIARELQLGTLRTALTLDNVALIDGAAISGTAARPEHALAAAEFKAATVYGGRKAMIHVDALVLTLLKSRGAITLSGQKWVTAMGNVVAADTGYTTVGGDHFLYVTLPLIVRLGGIFVVPGEDETARAQATDRATNLTTVVAQRLALVEFDAEKVNPADLVFKQQVDIEHDFDDV